MRRGIIAIGLVAGLAASMALPAAAQTRQIPALPAVAAAATPSPALHGVAVVAGAGAADVAWPLAQALYSDASLRPAGIDEAHARVLCGEAPSADAPADLRDLADTIAAVHAEDAPAKALLGVVARRLGVAAIVVVRVEAGRPARARVFLTETQEFDAATYEQDPPPNLSWTAAARSLARAYGSPSSSGASAPRPGAAGLGVSPVAVPSTAGPAAAPALATQEVSKAEPKKSRPFYVSPWFWGALGVAALAGGGAYLLSRDTGSSTIHLQVQGP
jgi:hypothetical protein